MDFVHANRKYFVLLVQNFHDFLVYRTRLFIIIVSQFVAPLVMLWVLTSLPSQYISGMSKGQITTYYLSTSILFLLMSSKIDTYVREAIQQGELATYLVKPIQFWLVALMKDASGRLIRLIVGTPIFVLLLFFYKQSFSTGMFSDISIILLMIAISFLLAFLISFSVGLLTFWVEEVWGFQNVKEASIVLLAGVALPYHFFPQALQHALVYTPFPYLVNWPLRRGFSGSIILEFAMALFWLIVFAVINILLWRNGLRKYSALGTY